MEKNNTLSIFLDQVGRTVIGEILTDESTDTILAVKNPAVVAVAQQQTGQISLQILPLFFKEFLADKSDSTVWYYKKENIVPCKTMLLDFKLNAQYQQLFTNIQQPQQPATPPQTDVVKLFDD